MEIYDNNISNGTEVNYAHGLTAQLTSGIF